MPKQRITKEMVVNAAFSLARTGNGRRHRQGPGQVPGLLCQPIYSYCESMEGPAEGRGGKRPGPSCRRPSPRRWIPRTSSAAPARPTSAWPGGSPISSSSTSFSPGTRWPLADLYARRPTPPSPAKIAADLGISPEAAQALHLHLLIYTIGIGTIFSVTSPGIPQEEIFQQQEEAYQAFLHHCLGGTQP